MIYEDEVEVDNYPDSRTCTVLDLFPEDCRHIDHTFDEMSSSASDMAVVEVFPKIFSDIRGWFTEVSKGYAHTQVKQINRSCSRPGTIRGFHAQKWPYCQGKLVEAINSLIYDIIIDARPDSETFGTVKVFILDPDKQNKLWIPRGFLHGFIVPPNAQSMAYFNYMCDNEYDKQSEVGINPETILEKLATLPFGIPDKLKEICDKKSQLIFSDKDLSGKDYDTWMAEVKSASTNWYCK